MHALIFKLLLQYAQNIVRFEFNSDFDVSTQQMEEVVNYWFNSHDDSFTSDTVGNYTIDQMNPDRGYFTQLTWAKSFLIGKYY